MDRLPKFIKFNVLPAVLYTVIYAISTYYSLVILGKMIYAYFKKPADKIQQNKHRPIPPKCLDDPQYGNHCYVQLKNVKLHYLEAGSKDKPLLILIHGFPEFWYSWRHQLKEFSKDYWVVALDTRGCGDSEKPQGYQYYRMKYLVEDVKNLLEALGRDKCILGGHDWGGIIAWYFISWYPHLVEKYIILNAPHPKAFRHHVQTSLTQLRMSWYIFFYQMPFLPELSLRMNDLKCFNHIFQSAKHKLVLNEEDLEAYKFMFGKPGAFTCPVNYYRANFTATKRNGEKKSADPSEFPPGLLIFGDGDFALEAVPLVDKSKKFVPGLRTELIQGACHFVHEDEPEKINEMMRDFLSAN